MQWNLNFESTQIYPSHRAPAPEGLVSKKGEFVKNILVIDDNPSDLTIVKFVLEKAKFHAILLTNPLEAFDFLANHHIDMIVLDWQMPQMSGMEFLKRIRRDSRYRTLPIMIMSGRNGTKDVKMAIQTGATDYVIKPIDPLIMESKLTRLFGGVDTWSYFRLNPEDEKSKGSILMSVCLTGLAETGCYFKSNAIFSVGQSIDVKLRLLEELGINSLPLRILSVNNEGKDPVYQAAFVGLKEGDLQKIRVFCRTLKTIDVLAA